MARSILVFDLGTTGLKATLYDADRMSTIASTTIEYPTYHPEIGWAEQDPIDWVNAIRLALEDLKHKANVLEHELLGISVCGQMMACLPVDDSDNPLRRAIIWMDTRSVNEVEYIRSRIDEYSFYSVTGNRVNPTYPIAKILWFKSNQKNLYDRTKSFIQPKDFIALYLTQGGEFISDTNDASLTAMMDIYRREWAYSLLEDIGIDTDKLPMLRNSTYIIGEIDSGIASKLGLPKNIPIVLGSGDGGCATLGASSIYIGDIYNYIGASSWITVVSEKPLIDRLMRTFNMVIIDSYIPTGTMQGAGLSLKWFKDNIFIEESTIGRILDKSAYQIIDMEASKSPPGSKGLIYLPYIAGERAPWWNPYARGVLLGLSLKHDRRDVARSILEGVGLNLRIILDVFREYKLLIREPMILIGGGAKSELWAQILSSIYGMKIGIAIYPEEATTIGGVAIAGLALKLYQKSDIKLLNRVVRIYEPIDEWRRIYDRIYPIFIDAYKSIENIFIRLTELQH